MLVQWARRSSWGKKERWSTAIAGGKSWMSFELPWPRGRFHGRVNGTMAQMVLNDEDCSENPL